MGGQIHQRANRVSVSRGVRELEILLDFGRYPPRALGAPKLFLDALLFFGNHARPKKALHFAVGNFLGERRLFTGTQSNCWGNLESFIGVFDAQHRVFRKRAVEERKSGAFRSALLVFFLRARARLAFSFRNLTSTTRARSGNKRSSCVYSFLALQRELGFDFINNKAHDAPHGGEFGRAGFGWVFFGISVFYIIWRILRIAGILAGVGMCFARPRYGY